MDGRHQHGVVFGEQLVTTHGAPAAVEGCALLAEILVNAIATGNKSTVLRSRASVDRDAISSRG
jgi:hypothetical protein